MTRRLHDHATKNLRPLEAALFPPMWLVKPLCSPSPFKK